MNDFCIFVTTLALTYFVSANSYLGISKAVRQVQGSPNFAGIAESLGLGATNGAVAGSGLNANGDLSVGSGGMGSGVTSETGTDDGQTQTVDIGAAVADTGNGYGVGSASGENSAITINTSGAASGAAGHSNNFKSRPAP